MHEIQLHLVLPRRDVCEPSLLRFVGPVELGRMLWNFVFVCTFGVDVVAAPHHEVVHIGFVLVQMLENDTK